tara:strand:+ start:97 stop:342 length:246 start_codon:yes stop_codon:yes gene_type:complete
VNWIGILFLLSVSSWSQAGMMNYEFKTEKECWNYFDTTLGLSKSETINFYNSKYKVKNYEHKKLGKFWVSCIHKDSLPGQK